MTTQVQQVNAEDHKLGFHHGDILTFKIERGLPSVVVAQISR